MQLYVGGQKPRKSEILGPNMPRSFRVMGHVTGHVQNFLITSSAQKELPASELCHHHSCQLYILTQEPCTRLQGKSAREKSYVAQLTKSKSKVFREGQISMVELAEPKSARTGNSTTLTSIEFIQECARRKSLLGGYLPCSSCIQIHCVPINSCFV